MTIIIVLLITATGCTNTDWFGNETPPTPIDKCAWYANEKELVTAPPLPLAQIEVLVRALRYNSDNSCYGDWPVPVSIHIYATAEGSPAIKMPNGVPLPWDGERLTPWLASFAVDPGDNKNPNPHITIDLIAKHAVEHPGNEHTTDRVALGCIIRVNGGTVANNIVGHMRSGEMVRCTAEFLLR